MTIAAVVTVTYTLTGTAEAPGDYTAPDPLSVSVPADETANGLGDSCRTRSTPPSPTAGDVLDEDDETVIVTLTGATNAALSNTAAELTATGTITDATTPRRPCRWATWRGGGRHGGVHGDPVGGQRAGRELLLEDGGGRRTGTLQTVTTRPGARTTRR